MLNPTNATSFTDEDSDDLTTLIPPPMNVIKNENSEQASVCLCYSFFNLFSLAMLSATTFPWRWTLNFSCLLNFNLLMRLVSKSLLKNFLIPNYPVFISEIMKSTCDGMSLASRMLCITISFCIRVQIYIPAPPMMSFAYLICKKLNCSPFLLLLFSLFFYFCKNLLGLCTYEFVLPVVFYYLIRIWAICKYHIDFSLYFFFQLEPSSLGLVCLSKIETN